METENLVVVIVSSTKVTTAYRAFVLLNTFNDFKYETRFMTFHY